jgi:hypothetical protein
MSASITKTDTKRAGTKQTCGIAALGFIVPSQKQYANGRQNQQITEGLEERQLELKGKSEPVGVGVMWVRPMPEMLARACYALFGPTLNLKSLFSLLPSLCNWPEKGESIEDRRDEGLAAAVLCLTFKRSL